MPHFVLCRALALPHSVPPSRRTILQEQETSITACTSLSQTSEPQQVATSS